MTGPTPASQPPATPAEEASLGQLVSEVAGDLQQLFRQELELAKAEVRAEAVKAGKAAGMLGGAGFAGYMVVVLLSLAAVFGLAEVIDLGWAALVVALVWAVAGAVLFVVGRNRMRTVSPVPQQTVDTLKEDAQWARHPTK
jgi:hypothetical protein